MFDNYGLAVSKFTSFKRYNNQSYQIRVVPVIESVGPQDGSAIGKLLKIKGSGFGRDKDQVSVRVGSDVCEVLFLSDTLIECLFLNATFDPRQRYFVGNSGIYAKNITQQYAQDQLLDLAQADPSLAIENVREVQINQTDAQITQSYSGLFYAPVDGLYSFQLSSYAPSALRIGTSLFDPLAELTPYTSPATCASPGSTRWLDFANSACTQQNYLMNAGFYQIQMAYSQTSELGFFVAGAVLPEDTNVSADCRPIRTTLTLVKSDFSVQVVDIKLSYSAVGSFFLTLSNLDRPGIPVLKNTPSFPCNVTAAVMRDALISALHPQTVTVTLQYLDSTDNVAQSLQDAYWYHYQITFDAYNEPFVTFKMNINGLTRGTFNYSVVSNLANNDYFDVIFANDDQAQLFYNETAWKLEYKLPRKLKSHELGIKAEVSA